MQTQQRTSWPKGMNAAIASMAPTAFRRLEPRITKAIASRKINASGLMFTCHLPLVSHLVVHCLLINLKQSHPCGFPGDFTDGGQGRRAHSP